MLRPTLSAALPAWLLACAGLFWKGSARTIPTKSDYTASSIQPAKVG